MADDVSSCVDGNYRGASYAPPLTRGLCGILLQPTPRATSNRYSCQTLMHFCFAARAVLRGPIRHYAPLLHRMEAFGLRLGACTESISCCFA